MKIVLVSKCFLDIEQYVGFKMSVLISPSKSLISSRWVTYTQDINGKSNGQGQKTYPGLLVKYKKDTSNPGGTQLWFGYGCAAQRGQKWVLVEWIVAKFAGLLNWFVFEKMLLSELIFGPNWGFLNWILTDF